MCSARHLATGSSAPTLTNLFFHSGSMASRICILLRVFQHRWAISMFSFTLVSVKAGWPSWPLCDWSLCSRACPSLCFMRAGDLSGPGGVVLEGVRDVEVVLPACDLLLDEGLLLTLVDLATLDLGQHELVQANVPAAFAEELLIQVRTLAGGRLQDQLGEARALVQIEERLPARVRVHYENHPCFAFAHLAVG